MSGPRLVTVIAIVLIPVCLYAYLDHARNDVSVYTRGLVKQIQKAEALAEAQMKASDERGAGDPDAFLAANERLARAHQRMFIRFHQPDRAPDADEWRFEELWRLLSDGDPGSVKYSEKQPKSDAGSHKRVTLISRDRDGDKMPLTIEWIKYRGGWYIDDFHHRDQDETAAAE
jgi:hypothetical protein